VKVSELEGVQVPGVAGAHTYIPEAWKELNKQRETLLDGLGMGRFGENDGDLTMMIIHDSPARTHRHHGWVVDRNSKPYPKELTSAIRSPPTSVQMSSPLTITRSHRAINSAKSVTLLPIRRSSHCDPESRLHPYRKESHAGSSLKKAPAVSSATARSDIARVRRSSKLKTRMGVILSLCN
jgi:hypothetical protein